MQSNLFSDIVCDHCGENPGIKPDNPVLWSGFLDMDTDQYCCYDCREIHYGKKQSDMWPDGGMTYSEFPVVVHHPLFKSNIQQHGRASK